MLQTVPGYTLSAQKAMTSRRIVAVAIDDSEHSSLAFDFYVKNVRKPDDHLVLIHVPEYDNAIKDSSWLTDPEIVAELLKDTDERSQELVNAYEIKIRELRIEGHVRQSCYGKPGETIIQAVKEEEANLLILGTRGRGLIRRTFLGSVSDYCLHHCIIPVIICRHNTSKHSKEHTKM